VLSVIRGAASVSAGGEQLQISVGQSVLIPAAVGAYKLAGTAEVLRSNQPG
jgi:mannose-6-phosphate isomerase class I